MTKWRGPEASSWTLWTGDSWTTGGPTIGITVDELCSKSPSGQEQLNGISQKRVLWFVLLPPQTVHFIFKDRSVHCVQNCRGIRKNNKKPFLPISGRQGSPGGPSSPGGAFCLVLSKASRSQGPATAFPAFCSTPQARSLCLPHFLSSCCFSLWTLRTTSLPDPVLQ